MTAVEQLQKREAKKRAEIQERIDVLRARRTAAARDLAGAREILIENPGDAGAKAVAAEAQTLSNAISAKLAELERDVRRLDVRGDDAERVKFAAKFDRMVADFGKLRDKQQARVDELGATIGRLMAATLTELRTAADEEQRRANDAGSLASFLDPTLTTHELSGMGLSRSGYSGLQRAARNALIRAAKEAGFQEQELRLFLDLG